ncbi:MAG: aldo/keto reductase [Clostridiales bacterium]|jgi:aryl-alcohol dehydrogenase-like predicted oxidoreductase|nr:aldo/keto reductase [Clostridiales bacterium]MDR2713373.1 aldo/keto reductase [Clostridiales bacterium]
MKMNTLGSTGLIVSELCIGTLPMGPLQSNIDVDKGAEILLEAMENGVNFFDTAQMYRTYPYLQKACKQYGKEVIIASKCAACDYKSMEDAIVEAMRELNRDHIDIFHVHAARADGSVFEKRAGAIEALLKAKEKGYVRFTGISAHNPALVALAAGAEEFDLVFPLINKIGLGILAGTLEDMLASIELVHSRGKAMYAMKALAGGHLAGDMPDAVNYVRSIPGIDAVSIGVVTLEELSLQLKIFNDEKIDPAILAKTKAQKQLKILPNLCSSCGTCIKYCPNGALSFEGKLPAPDPKKCVFCGYCTPVCPEFAIRVK